MSILHITQITASFHKTFDTLIDMNDKASATSSDRELCFLSRALAAFCVKHLTGCSPSIAGGAVTDGTRDLGIDAIYYSVPEKTLYLVQSKWSQGGTGSVDYGDLLKFLDGVKLLINANFTGFNAKVKSKKNIVESALHDASSRIMLILAYTGQAAMPAEHATAVKAFLDEMNDAGDVMAFQCFRQSNIYTFVTSTTVGSPINVTVQLREWGQSDEPYKAFYGQVAASDVADWWNKYHTRLFTPNIRLFLGGTDVNAGLTDTLLKSPERFWYFNNGITAVCSKIDKKPLGGSDNATGLFDCSDFAIVNGAQTVGAIGHANGKVPAEVGKAKVHIRVISLEHCPDEFGSELTRATNTQNRIDRRDFVALDPLQQQWRLEMQMDKVEYAYKPGDRVASPTNGFDLEEATVALACANSDPGLAVQAKREIGRLWDDIQKAPYKALFNSSVTSTRAWRLVQILRVINSELSQVFKQMSGRDAMVGVHGNRLLAHLIFSRLDLNQLDNPALDLTLIISQVKTEASDVYAKTLAVIDLDYSDSYLASLFKNQAKCKDIAVSVKDVYKK